MKNIWIIGLIVLMTLCVIGVSAQEYPVLKGYVTDNANLLTQEEESALSARIASIENKSSVEIAIVTVPSTNGEDTAQYATKIGDKNGVGKSSTDNGIVILVSMSNERGIFVATGSGIEGIITDSEAVAAYKAGKPYFADTKKQYAIGFNVILDNLEAELNKDDSATTAASSPSSTTPIQSGLPVWLILIVGGGLLLIFIIVIVIDNAPSGSHSTTYSPPQTYERTYEKKRKKDDNDDDLLAAVVATSVISSSSHSHSHYHDDSSSSSRSSDSDSDSGSSFSFGGGGFSGGGGGGGF